MADQSSVPETRDSLATLGRAWAAFIAIVASPAVLLLLLFTAALLAFSIYVQPSAGEQQSSITLIMSALVSFLVALLSGIVGARISQRLDELRQRGVLATRGKSAIRGLKLLLLNIGALETRIRTLLTRQRQNADPLVCQAFEELVDRCNTLEEEALNAIEEWQDILPEANISTQIGIITTLKDEQNSLLTKVGTLQAELESSKDESAQEREKLTAAVKAAQAELARVTKALRSKEAELSASLGSFASPVLIGKPNAGLSVSPFRVGNAIGSLGSTFQNQCANCQNTFFSVTGDKKCPYCGTSVS